MKFSASILFACLTSVSAFAPATFIGRSSSAINIAVGDKVPSAEFFSGFPDVQKVNFADYVKGKKVIVVGLPGAFTVSTIFL